MRRTITAAPAPTPPASPADTFDETAVGAGVLVTTTTRGLVDVSIVLVGDAIVEEGGDVGPGRFRFELSDVDDVMFPMPAW